MDHEPAAGDASGGTALLIGGGARIEPVDGARADLWRRDLGKAAREAGCMRLAAMLDAPERQAESRRLGAVLELSPHLRSAMLRRPDWLEQLFDIDAARRIAVIVAGLDALPGEGEMEGQAMTRLREAKAEACLLIALRDLFGAANVRETVRHLSLLAEGAVRYALRFCLLELHRRGALYLPDTADPERGCGLFVLGMGKLGGGELNYSSDIDLIVLFDPLCAAIVDADAGVEMFSRLVRRLVRMIGERTGDGYVFRIDLRLRPDPGAMPLAIPVPAAIGYYESHGRNWERAAMIKARCVAGDSAAAEAYLDELTPFVWRKYLDFVAIVEIQAMKDRIDRHRGYEGLGVAGHNVKLGPGGIREVEFFAQTQSLIAGGRSPALRLRRTEDTLRALAAAGWIGIDTAEELIEAYWFLRRVEHAVQMVADEQSHVLPETAEGLQVIARLLGFADIEGFSVALLARLRAAAARFAGLFAGDREGQREADAQAAGRLLDGDDKAAALAYLSNLGFLRPDDIARMLRGWGAGRYRATRAEATRRHLARVLPALLYAFASAPDPDAALAVFDGFLERLPAGLQFFALIASNPKILDLLMLILTASPRLAETIARRPHVFDALLDPAVYVEMPSRKLLDDRLSAFLRESEGYEDTLRRLRIFAAEQRFLIGVRLLSGVIEGEAAGLAFSHLADIVIGAALATVEAEFAERHGRVPGGRMTLLGLGRLGSRELTAASDVDLILLYDHDDGAEESDGKRSLPTPLYYARLTQRLIAALTAPMGEGILYAVDFRLRPSGNKGPLATPLEAFRRYQTAEARTWERMALTRSRPICGDGNLSAEVDRSIRKAIVAHRNPAVIAADVAAMRALIDREKPPLGRLDLKHLAGGIIDLEFLGQWAILTGRVPDTLIGAPTADVLSAFEASESLRNAHLKVSLHSSMRAFTRLIQLTRLGPERAYSLDQIPAGLGERLAKALELDDPRLIETSVGETARAVRDTFGALLPLT